MQKGNITIIDNEVETTHANELNGSTVIKNDTSWLIKDVPYTEPTQFEKDILKGTMSVEELLKKEEEEQAFKADRNRDIITKVKVIALNRLSFSPLANPTKLKNREKESIKLLMGVIVDKLNSGDLTVEELTKEFNETCLTTIFDEGVDISKYPVLNYYKV